jgi:hypothetical protein
LNVKLVGASRNQKVNMPLDVYQWPRLLNFVRKLFVL